VIALPCCTAQFPSYIHTGSCPRIHVLAVHVCAQCMTVGSAVHKTLSVLQVGLGNVVCAVLYMGLKHRVLQENMGWGCLKAGSRGSYLGLSRIKQEKTSDNYITSSFIISNFGQILLMWQNLCGHGMWHVKGELVNVYRVLVRKEAHGRPSGRGETILILIVKILRFYIKKILIWLCALEFIAEDATSDGLLWTR